MTRRVSPSHHVLTRPRVCPTTRRAQKDTNVGVFSCSASFLSPTTHAEHEKTPMLVSFRACWCHFMLGVISFHHHSPSTTTTTDLENECICSFSTLVVVLHPPPPHHLPPTSKTSPCSSTTLVHHYPPLTSATSPPPATDIENDLSTMLVHHYPPLTSALARFQVRQNF